MRNTSIFEQFDMVVSMTQKTINDQLVHLLRTGVIQSQLILAQVIQGNQYVYQVLQSAEQIPPGSAYINATLLPQIKISESGSDVTFVLNMVGGEAAFWMGSGPLSSLQTFTIDNWAYGISVNMNLYEVQQQDLGKKLKVPDNVAQQLSAFTSDLFRVNALFMDFESTHLIDFDPDNTTAGSSGDPGIQQMVLFMQFYLKWLVDSGNPYVLGYAINQTDGSHVSRDQNVPDSLKPVGTTYTMYSDPVNADRSNLNFVLVTKGGFGKISGAPGTFDTNWIGPNEQIDAKMIVSHEDLVEALLLEPFYNQLSNGVWQQIQGSIDLPPGNSYEAGKSVTDTGINYTISNVSSGDDQYVNTFSASFDNKDSQVDIHLKGHLSFYKEVDRSMGICNAEAWATGSIDWSGTLSITSSKGPQGTPVLALSQSPIQIDSSSSSSDQNTCAEAFGWIGKLLGDVLDAVTFFKGGTYFSQLLNSVFDLQVSNIGNVGQAFANLSNALGSNIILLPAGQEFFFKSPAIDAEGNFSLSLTYKSEH